MFDIVLTTDERHVYVRGQTDDVLTKQHALGPDFTLEALDAFAQGIANAAQRGIPIPPELLATARRLHQALFQLDVLDKLKDASKQTGSPLVIRLVVDDARLQKVPWEALCKPDTDEEFLAKGTSLQIIRGTTAAPPVGLGHVEPPLRVLVIGCELASHNFDAMKAVTTNTSDVEWLPPLMDAEVTWEQILRQLRTATIRPHIVHFVGHGSVRKTKTAPPDKPGTPVLGLSNHPNDEVDWIPAETLASELKANLGRELRLLVLETCEGAAPGGFGSAAETFIRSGVQAVFSSLWPIQASDAFKASRMFYEAFAVAPATRGDVIASVCAARRSLLVNCATGFSFLLHTQNESRVLLPPDKPVSKKKPNVLAVGRPRQKPPSEAPPPPPIAPIAVTGSHTSVVLDRIKQWQPILDHCASRNTHLVFVVHGTPQQSMSNFIKRIDKYLMESLREKKANVQQHQTVLVNGKEELNAARTADEWKRALIAATKSEAGEFDAVLPDETRSSSPVYVFVKARGPLHLDTETVQGFVDLFHGQLDPIVGKLKSKKLLKHPLRFVLPVEHKEPGRDPLLTQLIAGLQGMDHLKLEPLTEVVFPPWEEVWEYVVADCKGSEHDAPFQASCEATYDKVAQDPARTLQALGDALHPQLVAWKQIDVRKRR